MQQLTAADWERLASRLAGSRFRSRFRLDDRDRSYLRERGLEVVRSHASDFVRARLAPGYPARDGRQTPWRGHPVFVAQHATATCCRRCLAKWHAIPKGRDLTEGEIGYVVDVVLAWLGAPPD